MKREYFSGLFIGVFTASYLILGYFFDYNLISKYIMIWVLIAYFVGQYSTRFPKI